ncbi:TetR family transcriptional regulator [Siccirubricoccus sp. KC 17139]|uniref:TetR family transcriptional regulator n=1 Tax=Siccirubricoccus soli TaxID=2899147 RepID=A0ABT1D5T7_9PROT|nr:TetR family transcriptional regulator [Siccirubricoccus soli]MCO6416579.1 TetR family transcriptional regulator [Siccirubricoccus soli]MCP2682714.1 TetR family transcriptional regulator [Siccirubricoccus soli]
MSDETDTKLVAGLWQVVAAHGWHGVTMRRIAAASGVAPAEIRRRCPGPLALLGLHGRVTDQEVLEGTMADPTSTARDRLFDVIMRRIDAMQPHRAGVLRLLQDVRRDPLLGLVLLASLPRSMAWMLEAAEISTAGLPGLARANGLTAVWLATIRAWEKDPSPDLGATMAALDKALDRAEQVARSLRLPPI